MSDWITMSRLTYDVGILKSDTHWSANIISGHWNCSPIIWFRSELLHVVIHVVMSLQVVQQLPSLDIAWVKYLGANPFVCDLRSWRVQFYKANVWWWYLEKIVKPSSNKDMHGQGRKLLLKVKYSWKLASKNWLDIIGDENPMITFGSDLLCVNFLLKNTRPWILNFPRNWPKFRLILLPAIMFPILFHYCAKCFDTNIAHLEFYFFTKYLIRINLLTGFRWVILQYGPI